MIRVTLTVVYATIGFHFGSVLADITPPGMTPDGNVTWWAPLINTGAIGVVLGWFMLRMEPRMRAIEAAIDRVSRALMVAVLAMKSLNNRGGVDVGLKEQAEDIVSEVDEASKRK